MQATLESTRTELQDFEALVRLHWQCIYRFILASVRNADAAEALTQDCFLRSFSKRDSFRSQSSVKTWLMKIAINLVRDFCGNRRHQFWKRLRNSNVTLLDVTDSLPGAGTSPEDQALLNEQVQMVWHASQSLPNKQRTVFLLRFVEDMDLLEIAAATGMKEGTVKIHLFRAIHAVRERLGRLK
jgi:RNA polymerase sigma-70 factor, ECF subfamily